MKRKLQWPDILTEFRELNPHDEVAGATMYHMKTTN